MLSGVGELILRAENVVLLNVCFLDGVSRDLSRQGLVGKRRSRCFFWYKYHFASLKTEADDQGQRGQRYGCLKGIDSVEGN